MAKLTPPVDVAIGDTVRRRIDQAAAQFQRTERRRAAIDRVLGGKPVEPAVSKFDPINRKDAP